MEQCRRNSEMTTRKLPAENLVNAMNIVNALYKNIELNILLKKSYQNIIIITENESFICMIRIDKMLMFLCLLLFLWGGGFESVLC